MRSHNPTPTPKENWEIEFDKQFEQTSMTEQHKEWVKSFICSLLDAKTEGEQGLRALEEEEVLKILYEWLECVHEPNQIPDIAKSICAHFARPVVSREKIKDGVNDWLSCGESRLTPDDVNEITDSIIHHLLEGKKG